MGADRGCDARICTRWEDLYPLGGAAPAGWGGTRWEGRHPLDPGWSLVVVEPAVDVAGEPAVHACGGGVGQFTDVVGDQPKDLDVCVGAIG